jgi:fused signal recognition particle receptor
MVSLKTKLSRTRSIVKDKIDDMLQGPKDREKILDDLTEILLLSDAGMTTTEKIIDSVREKTRKSDSASDIKQAMENEIVRLLESDKRELNMNPDNGTVIMFVGVNGGGKTTSLAKLAYNLKESGQSVLMVAADTFRAAAQEQLALWGKRLHLPVITGQYKADPAALVFDSIQSFKARQLDSLLIDTAGRLHTDTNLMNELEKIKRAASRHIQGAPHETLLVLDASIGQNALFQAKEFLKFSGLTGIFLSKLDGTAKGGSVLSIVDECGLPVKYIGVGEDKEDIMPFSPEQFAAALLS